MKVIYVKSCMERDPRFRQQTLILQSGKTRLARKRAVSPESAEHMKAYLRNRKALLGVLSPESRIRVLPCTENPDGSVDFPFCSEPSFSDCLYGLPVEEYICRVTAFQTALTEAFGTIPFHAEKDFVRLFGDFPALKQTKTLISLKITNPDLNFDNIFCANRILSEEESDKANLPSDQTIYTMIDYEWIMTFPVPLPFVFYRALLLDPTFRLFSAKDRRRVMDALGIGEDLEEVYARMETAFLASVSPEETRLSYYATHATSVTRVNHRLDLMLSYVTRDRSLPARLHLKNHPVVQAFRKSLGETRSRIQASARKRNAFGAFCSLLVSLGRVGPTETFLKIIRHFQARQSQKDWIRNMNPAEAEQERQRSECFPRKITFSILVPLYNTPLPFLQEMIDSVRNQTYQDWELCLADGSDDSHTEVGDFCRRAAMEDSRIRYRCLERNLGISENTNACMDMARGDYFVLFDHDDLLHPSALYENMKVICAQDADFIYSDEAVFASPVRENWISIHFKPDFAPENLLSNNYICHLSVFRASLLEQAGRFRPAYDGSQDHDLILRLTSVARNVVHIPKILYYWRSHAASVAGDIGAKTYAVSAGQRAVHDFLASRGQIVFVESAPLFPTLYRIRFSLSGSPSVRIILFFEQNQDPVRYLQALAPTLVYGPIAFTVIVPGPAPQQDVLSAYPVAWMQAKEGGKANNLAMAANQAKEDILLFLSPSLVPASWNWLRELLSLAVRDDIGAVGAMSVFADGTVRHAGLVLSLGKKRLIGRSQFGVPAFSGGYFGQLAILENVSAVSSECLAIRRDRFEAAGGFTSGYSDVLFDADLCLKLQEMKYRNLVTPFSEMKGGKKRSFSLDFGAESPSYVRDAGLFRKNWEKVLEKPDPYYNLNLTLDGPDCALRRNIAGISPSDTPGT